MKKFLVACALILAVLGTATVFTLNITHAAYADGGGNGGGH